MSEKKMTITGPIPNAPLEMRVDESQRVNPAPRRYVIQVAPVMNNTGGHFIVAVCNDGTIWRLDGLYEGEYKWEPFPTPPCCSHDHDQDGNCDRHPREVQ